MIPWRSLTRGSSRHSLLATADATTPAAKSTAKNVVYPIARAVTKTVLVVGFVFGAASLHAGLSNQVWFVTWNGAPTPSGDVSVQTLSTAGTGVAGGANNFVSQAGFPAFNSPYEIAVDPAMGKAYVLDNNLQGVTPEYIYSFNLTGTPAQIAASAQIIYTMPVPQADVNSNLYPLLSGMALDAANHRLYFCQFDATISSNSWIGRLDLASSSKSDNFSSGGGNPTLQTFYTGRIPGQGKIAIDSTNIYLGAINGLTGNDGIYAAPLAGGGAFTEIVTLSSGDVHFPNGLVGGIACAPQNNLIYYLTFNAGYVNHNFATAQNALWTYDTVSHIQTKISSGYPGYPDDVTLDPPNSRYYFTTGQDGTGNVTLTNYQAIYTGVLGSTNAPTLLYSLVLGGQDTAANAGNVAIQGIYIVDIGVAAPAVVALNSNTLNQVYNGLPRIVTAGATPAGLALTITYNGSTNPPTKAGNYGVVATVSDPNYTGLAFGTLTVAAAPLTVTANNVARAFGVANPVFTGSIVGLQNNDNITATYSCSATTSSPDGIYQIVPNLVDPQGALSNYTVTTNIGALTIGNPRPQISGAMLTGRTLSASIQSQQGLTYTLQAVNGLPAASWTAVQSVAGTGGAISLTDTNTTAPVRFYRVRVQ